MGARAGLRGRHGGNWDALEDCLTFGSRVKLKIPVSVLVIVHTPQLDVLLIERAARPGYWQSVTGSLDWQEEPLEHAALREVREETGLGSPPGRLLAWNLTYTFEIYPEWRHRFAHGATHNVEHVFSLELPGRVAVTLAPDEHAASLWLSWRDAADKCFSWSNRDAIRMLAERRGAERSQPVDPPLARPSLR